MSRVLPSPLRYANEKLGGKQAFDYANMKFSGQVKPLAYASSDLAAYRRKRIAFGQAPKYLPSSLKLEGRYFSPLNPMNKITVEHNRFVTPTSQSSFAKYFNKATDFYGQFTRASGKAAVEKPEELATDYGTTTVPVPEISSPYGKLRIGILQGHQNRFVRPSHLVKKTGLLTFISLGGT